MDVTESGASIRSMPVQDRLRPGFVGRTVTRLYLYAAAVALAVVILLVALVPGTGTWGGWTAVSAISALIGSIGIVLLISQFVLQEKSHSLEQLQFLMNLTPQWLQLEAKFENAIMTLPQVEDVPDTIPEAEWYEYVDRLRDCYESTLFLYQIAQLAENGLLDREALYLLHYGRIVHHPSWKLTVLTDWCGTGLDLAANFNAHEVSRIVAPVKRLLIDMSERHRRHGGEPYEYQIEDIKKLEEEFVSRAGDFLISSPSYQGRLIGTDANKQIAMEEVPDLKDDPASSTP